MTLTATSRPAPATAAATSRWNRRGRSGSAAPPPRAVTLRTGQPKFRSMCRTPPAASIRAASPAVSGRTAYSCADRTASSGWNRARWRVFGLPATSSCARIISLTQTLAPARAHISRSGALVSPAIGASSSGGWSGGRVAPSCRGATSPGLAGATAAFKLDTR